MNIALAVFIAIFNADRDRVVYHLVKVNRSADIELVSTSNKCVFNYGKYTVLKMRGTKIRIFYDGQVGSNNFDSGKTNTWTTGVNINKCK